jgi:hypothetical protein
VSFVDELHAASVTDASATRQVAATFNFINVLPQR